jgi:polysaccharide export outer membrane protein
MNMLIFVAFLFMACPQQAQADGDSAKVLLRSVREATDYRVGPGDLLEITVFGVDKYNQSARISASGFISVPHLGKLAVSGLAGAEIEEKLEALMVEKKLILNPQVLVFIKEYQSQPIYVMGAVHQPGQFMISRSLNVIDALAIAGGVDLNRSGDALIVQRRPGENGEIRKETIRLVDLLEKGNPEANIEIRSGDVIQVSERKSEVFYVIGEVGRPGAYELPKEKTNLTMAQALGLAGGPLKTAKMKSGMLIRYEPNGARTEIAMNWKKILDGKAPDIPVRADDVIFMPGSNIKTIGFGLLGAIPNAVSSTMSGSVVNRSRY